VGTRNFHNSARCYESKDNAPVAHRKPEKKETLDRRVYPIALSSFLIGTSISMILPLMPMFCKEIGVSAAGYGVMVGAVGLSRLCTNAPAGFLADRVGRRPLLISGPAITAVGIVGMGLSHSFYPFLCGRILTGIGGSLDMTAAQLYLSDISTPRNRAQILAPAVMAFSAGSVVGPAIGGWLAGNFSMQLPFFVVGGCIAGVVANNYLMLPETRKNLNTATGSNKTLRHQLSKMFSQCKPLLRQRDIRSVLCMHGSFWFVSSSCIYTMLPMLGTELFSLSPSEVAVWYVTMSVINILGTRLSAKMSDTYGRKIVLVPGAAFISMATLLMPFADSYSALTALVCFWGIGGAMFGANTTAYLTDKTTDGTKSQALMLLRSCADIGLMLGGAFAGIMSQFVSADAPFILASLLMSGSGIHMAFRASESNTHAQPWRKTTKQNPKLK